MSESSGGPVGVAPVGLPPRGSSLKMRIARLLNGLSEAFECAEEAAFIDPGMV